MTDGETRARPAVAVCCVAIVVALSSRFARQSPVVAADAFWLVPKPCPSPSPFPRTRRGRGGRTPLPAALRDTRSGGDAVSSLEQAGLLHHGGRALLGL